MAAVIIRGAAVVMVALLSGFAQSAGAGNSPFAESWIDAAHGSEPQLQIQRYDDDTYILRQSIKTNVEGPFLYLFFGTNRIYPLP
jgi:hydroxyacylglutathione hydrolase